jgi:hypothetical protein
MHNAIEELLDASKRRTPMLMRVDDISRRRAEGVAMSAGQSNRQSHEGASAVMVSRYLLSERMRLTDDVDTAARVFKDPIS